MDRRFISAISFPDEGENETAWWFIFRGSEILTTEDVDNCSFLLPELPVRSAAAPLGLPALGCHYLGRLAGRHCIAAEVPADVSPPPGMTFRGLRALFGLVSDDLFAVAGRAAQIVEWDRSHRYCGRCGAPTELATGERAKRCPRCGHLHFPRLSPAVIVLVERDDHVLLARSPHFAPGMYSALAGFVEPGESLEEAAQREILEEVGIEVTDLRYFGSQPWPFPHSLMLGFTARYAGGEIRIDRREIEDARWFTAHTLPRVPQRLSIARRLIDNFVARYGAVLDQP